MTPRQLRYAENGPWEDNGGRSEVAPPACPACGSPLRILSKPYDTADSAINVLVCNQFSDGKVMCSNLKPGDEGNEDLAEFRRPR